MSAILVARNGALVVGCDAAERHMIHMRSVVPNALLVDTLIVDANAILFFAPVELIHALAPIHELLCSGRMGVNDTLTPLIRHMWNFNALLIGVDFVMEYDRALQRWREIPPTETLILATPDVNPMIAQELRTSQQDLIHLINSLHLQGKLGAPGFHVHPLY